MSSTLKVVKRDIPGEPVFRTPKLTPPVFGEALAENKPSCLLRKALDDLARIEPEHKTFLQKLRELFKR